MIVYNCLCAMVGTGVLPLILAGTVVYLQAFVLVAHGHGQDMTVMPIAPPEIPEEKCERITDVPICADMPWNYTLFPNLRDHPTQTDANQELEQFRQLIQVNCSGAIVIFLCSIYTPFCTDEYPIRVLRPCKRLCMHVRDRCEPVFNQRAGGLQWPGHLHCDNY